MVEYAKEAAEAAKAAKESGAKLTDNQKQWLAYSEQLDSLGASVANAKSALGGVLLPVLSELSKEGAAFLNDFSRDMEAAAGDSAKQGKVMSDYIVKGATLIKEKLPEYVKMGKELFGGLGEGLKEAGPDLLDMGLDLVMDLCDQIIQYAPELAEAGISLVEKLTESLIEQGPELTSSAIDMVTKIVTGLAQAAPSIIPAAGQLVTQLILALIESAPDLLLAGLELVYGIISGLVDGLGDIIGASDEIIESIKETFREKGDDFLEIGSKIIAKIKEGILNSWDAVKKWFGDLVGGLGGSITVSGKSNTQSINSMELSDFASRSLYQTGRAVANKVVNLTIHTTSLSPAEVDALVDYINRKLGDDM